MSRAAALPRARGRDRARPQGEGSLDREPGVREGRLAPRQGAEAHAEEAGARGAVALVREPGGAAAGRRGGDRRHRLDVDGHPRLQAHRSRVRAARPHGGGAAQARHRPGRGDRRRREVDPPRPRRDQGSEAADRLVHLPRPVRRRQDRARAHARRVPVRRRGRDDPGRHVGVHGEALRVPARRLASGLHRLRRRRPAHRGRAAQAVLGAPARRDREGASRRVQHPPADPRGGEADRRPGAPRRLPERDRDHDLEPRRGARSRRTPASASPSATSPASRTTR